MTTEMKNSSFAEGRKAIGIEIEERSCEIAANRLRQEVFGCDESSIGTPKV